MSNLITLVAENDNAGSLDGLHEVLRLGNKNYGWKVIFWAKIDSGASWEAGNRPSVAGRRARVARRRGGDMPAALPPERQKA